MHFKAGYIPYQTTGAFSQIIIDYLNNAPALKPFYNYTPGVAGIKEAIAKRKKFPVNRKALVEHFQQHHTKELSPKVNENISSLLDENTFTLCTAHQPNIFTGHLYFIYKILHTILLADRLNSELSGYHFVPVYYMGSEDADLDELGEVSINGKKYRWKTKQSGAVGRMIIDKEFIKLVDEIAGQLEVEQHGPEIIALTRKYYTIGKSIEQATFDFVSNLFSAYGLLILLPDTPGLKKEFIPLVIKELEGQFSNKAVSETIKQIPEEYRVQAVGREINLFYLVDNIRERIEIGKGGYKIANTSLSFSREEMMKELGTHPERFSPNVILRPVYQELILPNLAFIGGGGELAYWLELGKVFESAGVHFPMLILRNSFMVVTRKAAAKMTALEIGTEDIFKPLRELVNDLVKRETTAVLELDEEKKLLQEIYLKAETRAVVIDPTFQKHVKALYSQSLKRLDALEKKMLKAERKKFEAQQRQLQKIKAILFPGDSLQERVDNILPYYAQWGREFIDELYKASKSFEQEFCILKETKEM